MSVIPIFDPTKPVEDSPLDAAEMRQQFGALKSLIDVMQEQFSPLVPIIIRSADGQWTLSFTGPEPAVWQVWSRDASNPAWQNFGEMQANDFPALDDAMVPDGVAWWQVRIVGVNDDGKQSTPFSNVISFGPVP